MVAYELSLVMKAMPKVNLVQAVKRVAEMILFNRGLLEKIEFLGSRQLPYRINTHGHSHSKGSYFLIQFHIPYNKIDEVKDNCVRDPDIVRKYFNRKQLNEEFSCSLHEETLPPSYRSDVSKMIEEANNKIPKHRRMEILSREQLKNYKF